MTKEYWNSQVTSEPCQGQTVFNPQGGEFVVLAKDSTGQFLVESVAAAGNVVIMPLNLLKSRGEIEGALHVRKLQQQANNLANQHYALMQAHGSRSEALAQFWVSLAARLEVVDEQQESKPRVRMPA